MKTEIKNKEQKKLLFQHKTIMSMKNGKGGIYHNLSKLKNF